MSEVLEDRRFQEWLRRAVGEDRADELRKSLDEFAQREKPVITLFGAFDTGKSAIARRLLVDAGLDVPEWLTISARHETFESRHVEVDGYVLQDTPGISDPDVDLPTDLRAEVNTRQAMDAIALTDVACIVVNPQLPTGERDQLLALIEEGWIPGSLIVVISRFDDAGANPLYDLDGYRDRAANKVAELRRSLELDETIPIHVVVPDFEQVAGASSSPDPTVWDESRDFDGMSDLAAAFSHVATRDTRALRAAAVARFWASHVRRALLSSEAELEDLEAGLNHAEGLIKRRDIQISQLDVLDAAARVSIMGAVEDAINASVRRQSVSAEGIQSSVDHVLETWWLRECAALDKLASEAGVTFERQRERPGWQVLTQLFEPDAGPAAKDGQRKYAGRLGGVTDKVKSSFDAVKKLEEAAKETPKEASGGATKAVANASKSVPKVEVAVHALPAIVELAGLIEDIVQDKQAAKRRRERRDELHKQVRGIAQDAADQALVSWQHEVEATRATIAESVGIDDEQVDALKTSVDEVRATVVAGRRLMAI
ncbi:GTPase domain-containing protein [Nocardioides perillae]|uniref:50S ribosome-binding GTPase n=1 Tax=Nocardioides perillae TaxID=1119534 RepID=A0A7Y9US57_9ACTN|nr:GTPase domain-containing protein [Nocardioides perillae]NYG55274.1 hypothetical protein [Nocardioides perillae]